MYENMKSEDYMGMIFWNRTSGSPRPLFGTEIETANSIKLEVCHADTVNFAVKKYENDGRTLWMSKGTDVIVQEKLYRISDRCREVYCRTVDEWLAIHNVSLERLRARHSVENERMTESFSRKALTVIRKQKGFKSTKLSDIISIERRNATDTLLD